MGRGLPIPRPAQTRLSRSFSLLEDSGTLYPEPHVTLLPATAHLLGVDGPACDSWL
jgi:hypothetical protein